MRDDFPFFEANHTTIYLDSAATSQTLNSVVDDTKEFLINHKANAHRSGHSMGTWINNEYYRAKEYIGAWLNIDEPNRRIVFNSGTTQGLNDAARMIEQIMPPGGVVFIGRDSHHSLILPFTQSVNGKWRVVYVDLDATGRIDLTDLQQKIAQAPLGAFKVVAVTAVSNVLGVVNDIKSINKIAHDAGAVSILDASQIIGKGSVDFSGWDFVAWSWHKVYGPMGLGCLLIDTVWLNFDPPRPGGGAVGHVSWVDAVYLDDASRFESGTQNLAAIAAIPNLVAWLSRHQTAIEFHDTAMTQLALSHVNRSKFTPVSEPDSGLISLKPHVGTAEDYAMFLDAKNVMVRTGKLCAEPLVAQLGSTGLIRISWAAYTTASEIEQTFNHLEDIYGRVSRIAQ
jgi:cysteine desulfurase/selenocysteine lyase